MLQEKVREFYATHIVNGKTNGDVVETVLLQVTSEIRNQHFLEKSMKFLVNDKAKVKFFFYRSE